jgi:hypothetical protein
MRKHFVLLVVLLAWSSSCHSNRSTASLPMGVTINCDAAIDELADPPVGFRVWSDAVALPSEDREQGLGRSGPDNDPTSARRFAKVPLIIKRGEVVDLLVGAHSQRNVLVSWGKLTSSGPASHLTSERCSSSDDVGQWLVFPGGVWVLEPQCVELVVQVGRSREIAKLDVGQRC